MAIPSESLTIGQLVAQRPSRARVFEQFGLDYCCGGGKPLSVACAEKGIAIQAISEALSKSDEQSTSGQPDRDWTKSSLSELVDNILNTHHAFLKAEMPRLTFLVDKVAAVHHARHPELQQVKDYFHRMKNELESHLQREEEELFPICKALDKGAVPDQKIDLNQELDRFEKEHESTGGELDEIRKLTHEFSLPPDGCNTYRAMLDSLKQLEADLHSHVNKENYALYPKARAALSRCR